MKMCQIYTVYKLDGVVYCVGVVAHTGQLQPMPIYTIRNVDAVRQFVMNQQQGMVPSFRIRTFVDIDF